MKELIKIQINEDEQLNQTVNARDLHEFLESKQNFADWMRNRIREYKFEKGNDFIVYHNPMKNSTCRPANEYALSLEMAKEHSMAGTFVKKT